MTRLLIIDDDQELYALLADYLGQQGFVCGGAADAASGLARITAETWDAVILDVMLPGMNGLDVLQRIRSDAATRVLPVLMLTARGEEIDRVVGLEMGADDYLAKPFSARELVARLRALLRRSGLYDETPSDPKTLDDLSINKAALSVTVNGRSTDVSVSELRLLEILTAEPGQVVNRETLYKTLFGHPAYPYDRSLDMLVSRLRKRLGPRTDGGERIKAVRGEGYVYLLAGDQS